MKQIIFFLLAVTTGFCGMSQSGSNTVTIKGKITGDLKGHNKIFLLSRVSSDSAIITNGEYSFTFPYEQPVFRSIFPEYLKHEGMVYQPFGILIAGPGTYYVNSDMQKGLAQSSEVRGPEAAVLYRAFELESNEAHKTVNIQLGKIYGNNWYRIGEKDPVYVALQKSRDSLQALYTIPVIEKLVQEHPDSYASAFVLSGAGRQINDIKKQEQLLKKLSGKMKKSDAGQKFADHISGLKNSATGRQVADFRLPDPQGKEVALSQFKGKYILLDFWASWCGPCRKSFPRMREVYNTYKNDGFEIYSISIDENRPAWLKAVDEENNPWQQTLDNKNISQSHFAVTAVPTTFLLDPSGKIMLREIGFDPNGGSEIEKKLAEIFGKKLAAPVKEEKQPAKEEKKPAMIKAIPMTRM